MEIHSVRKIKLLKADHISHAELKRQGWSDSLIKKFLGEPDALAENPIVKSAPPMRFYLKTRVEHAEQSQAFLEAKQKSQQRSLVSKQVAEQKKQELLAWVDSLDIKIKSFSSNENLFKSAVNHYNKMKDDYAMMRGYTEDFCFVKWDQCEHDFLHRITVNFLRHRCSSYEKRLEEIYGKVGVNEAYVKLKTKVLKAIAEKYPFLTDECERQIEMIGKYYFESTTQNE